MTVYDIAYLAFIGAAGLAGIVCLAGAIVTELRKPADQRSWNQPRPL